MFPRIFRPPADIVCQKANCVSLLRWSETCATEKTYFCHIHTIVCQQKPSQSTISTTNRQICKKRFHGINHILAVLRVWAERKPLYYINDIRRHGTKCKVSAALSMEITVNQRHSSCLCWQSLLYIHKSNHWQFRNATYLQLRRVCLHRNRALTDKTRVLGSFDLWFSQLNGWNARGRRIHFN